jgi:uncharacterized cupin superfamily protein
MNVHGKKRMIEMGKRHGDAGTIRSGSTTGSHRAGLWKIEGPVAFEGNAPDGDETLLVLEGEGTVTITATGKQHRLVPGSIVSHPRGLAVRWEIKSPSFKKLWMTWTSEQPGTAGEDLYIGHVNDDSGTWEPYEWIEPENGLRYSCGELFVLRSTGSTGMLRCGLWRSTLQDDADLSSQACNCGRCAGHRIGSARGVGDETMILLEGAAQLVDEDTGESYDFEAGDIIAVYEGLNGRWTSKAPVMKKFWVVTNANVGVTQ